MGLHCVNIRKPAKDTEYTYKKNIKMVLRILSIFGLVFFSIINVLAVDVHPSKSGERLPVLPNFLPEKKPIGSLLPTLKPRLSGKKKISDGDKFLVKGFTFTGNTVFNNHELQELSKTLINTSIGISDLFALRDNITQEYIRKGYLNSGVILPEQAVSAGIVKFIIVEGRLTGINATTDGRLDPKYVAEPIRRNTGPVLNVFKIEERLQLLQQDSRIESMDAKLEPGSEQGSATLNIIVKENLPYDFRAEVNNHASPNIGAEGIKLTTQHDNITGSGNQIIANFEKTEGFTRFSLNYSQPFVGTDKSMDVYASASRSLVVDKNFQALDIEDQSQTVRFSLRESKIQNINRRFDWYLSAYYQHGATFLLGEPFSFGDPRDDGEIDLTGLRFGTDWKSRSNNQVVVIGLSSGIGILLPDDDDDDDDDDEEAVDPTGPDGKSFTLNANLQWARKFVFLNSRLFSRFDMQLSNNALYGAQQFSLGGHASVRGYRENLIVRDNGVLGSVEYRVPVMVKSGTRISLALFTDAGRAWQTGRKDNGPRVIASVGGGVVGTVKKHFQFNLYWAKALRDIDYLGESNLQDQGFHFSLSSHWR